MRKGEEGSERGWDVHGIVCTVRGRIGGEITWTGMHKAFQC